MEKKYGYLELSKPGIAIIKIENSLSESLEFEIIYANSSFCRIAQIGLESAVNLKSSDLNYDKIDEINHLLSKRDIILQNGTVSSERYFSINENKWYKVDYSSTESNVITVIYTDITQEAFNEISFLNERNLFLQGPTVVWKWGAEPGWPIHYVSENVYQLLGYKSSELRNAHYIDLISKKDIERVTSEVSRIYSEGVEYFEHEPYRLLSKDGSEVYVRDFTAVNSQASGVSFNGYIVDVTTEFELMQKTRDQNVRLNNIIESTNIGTWEWNIQTGETHFNEKWANIVGYTLSELEPVSIKTWAALAHPQDFEESQNLLEEHFKGKSEFYNFDSRMKHKNGEWVWVNDRGRVIEWTEDNKPKLMFGTHTEISERKKFEQELNNTKTELEGFFNIALDLLCIANLEGRFIRLNKAWENILGYKLEELEGQFFIDFVHPDDKIKTLDALKDLSEEKDILNFVNRYRNKDGSYRFIEWRSRPVGDLIYAAARDISEKIEYENALKESRLQLNLFFNQSLDGFFFMMLDEPVKWNDDSDKKKILDYVFKHQRITRINRAMLDQYKMKKDDFIGLTPYDFFKHDLQEGYKFWTEFFDEGRLHIDTNEKRSDGTDLVIEGDYICLYNEQGEITGHFGVQRDITEQRRIQNKLKETAVRDPLTGVYNRRFLFDRLIEVIEKYKRDDHCFSIALCDIDHFKNVNDVYGHLAGDYILKEFVDLLHSSIRVYDVIARYGGEEFIIIFSNMKSEQTLPPMNRALETLRDKVYNFDKKEIKFTFSCGISDITECNSKNMTPEEIVNIADRRLYKAKEEGRNRIYYKD